MKNTLYIPEHLWKEATYIAIKYSDFIRWTDKKGKGVILSSDYLHYPAYCVCWVCEKTNKRYMGDFYIHPEDVIRMCDFIEKKDFLIFNKAL